MSIPIPKIHDANPPIIIAIPIRIADTSPQKQMTKNPPKNIAGIITSIMNIAKMISNILLVLFCLTILSGFV